MRKAWSLNWETRSKKSKSNSNILWLFPQGHAKVDALSVERPPHLQKSEAAPETDQKLNVTRKEVEGHTGIYVNGLHNQEKDDSHYKIETNLSLW